MGVHHGDHANLDHGGDDGPLLGLGEDLCWEEPDLVIIWFRFGGLAVSFVSSAFDSKNLVLSIEISFITFSSWVGIFTVTMMGIGAIGMLCRAIALSNAVLVSFIICLTLLFPTSFKSSSFVKLSRPWALLAHV